jgi:hypothetical protein
MALAAAEAFHVVAELVDPDRHLVAEGGWHGVLAVGAPRQQHLLGALCQVGKLSQQGGELRQEDVVCAPQQQELAGLGNVLCRGTPVHVAAGVAVTHPVQFPDQRHQRVSRTRQSGADVIQVQQRDVGLTGDLFGSLPWDYAQLRLRLG